MAAAGGWRHLLCGAVSGGTQGSIGVGGGIIMTSSLVRLGGLKHAQAVGTSLPCQIVGNAVSGATFAAAGHVDPLALLCVGGAAIIGARGGAQLSSRMGERQAKGASGALILGLAPIIAWSAWRKEQQHETQSGADQVCQLQDGQGPPPPAAAVAAAGGDEWTRAWAPHVLLTAVREHPLHCLELTTLGLCTGICTGALGIGATPIMITALTLSGAHSYKTCVGTALCAVVPSGAAAAVTHAQLGNTHWKSFPLLAAGVALGGYAGSSIALDLPTALLQQVFAVFCAFSGGSMLRKALFTSSTGGAKAIEVVRAFVAAKKSADKR